MNIAAACLALTVSLVPLLRQVPVIGEGLDVPAKDLSVMCHGASGTAVYDGKQTWDTGAIAIPGAAAPGPYTVRVLITLHAKVGPIGPLRYDRIVVTASPNPIGAAAAQSLIWSGDGDRNDFPLESVGATGATFGYPVKGLSISW